MLKSEGPKWTWLTLLLSNMRFLANKKDKNIKMMNAIENIFGYENPYKRSIIVWGIRKKYDF